MAWISFFIGIIVFMCVIPGVREDTEKIDAYIQSEKSVANTSFLSILKLAMKQKNFGIYIIVHFMNQVLMACLGASIHYAVRYVLGETTDVALIMYDGYFLGAFLGVPIWVKIGQRLKNNKKLLIILGLLLVLTQVPLLFLKQLGVMGTAIMIIPYGFSFSGFWTTLTITVSADVVDDVIVNIKMRKESILTGIRAFFLRLAIVAQSIIFAVVHTLTNFTEGAATQPLSAQWGILVHLALIPLICILVAILIFWKWYDITPEKREKILIQLKELNL
jgi:Na+/melibiose symporter-like transporter